MSFSVAFSDVDDEGAYFGIDPNFGVDSQVASTLGPFWVVDSPGDTSNWVARSGTALNTGASSAFVLITEVQPQPECAFEFTDQSTFTDAIESPTLIDFEGIVGSGEVLFLGSPGQFSEGGFSATTGSSRLFIVSWDTYSTGATMAVQQAAPNVVTLTMPSGVRALGFSYQTYGLATVQLDGGQIFNLETVPGGTLRFFGVARSKGIPIKTATITIIGGNIDIDNVIFTNDLDADLVEPPPRPAEVAKLTASDGETYDRFGMSVALDKDTAVIGTPSDSGATGTMTGSAYVFTQRGAGPCRRGVWSEQAKLTVSEVPQFGRLGFATAVYGNTAVIGAVPLDNTGSGSAYVFTRSDGIWSQQTELVGSDSAVGDKFGNAISVGDDTAVIGAYDNLGRGAVYVFTRSDGVWAEQAKLTASSNDVFGWSVALDGDTVVVGAITDLDTGDSGGSAYVFTRSDGIWSEQTELVGSDSAVVDDYGSSVAIDGDTVVVGARRDGGFETGAGLNDSGAAYVFTRTDGIWTEQTKLTASDPAVSGSAVAVEGDTVVVSASGFAYVFTRSDGIWSKQAKLTAREEDSNAVFGASIALDGGVVVIGAPFGSQGIVGAAHVFSPVPEPATIALQLAAFGVLGWLARRRAPLS